MYPDIRMPAYAAPEYALDEVLATASDMYSLGCVVYAVHSKGDPPFKNFGNLGSIRENASKSLPRMDRFDRDLQCSFSQRPLLYSVHH